MEKVRRLNERVAQSLLSPALDPLHPFPLCTPFLLSSFFLLLTEADAGKNSESTSSVSRYDCPPARSANHAMDQSILLRNVLVFPKCFTRYHRVNLPADFLGNLNSYTTSLSLTL